MAEAKRSRGSNLGAVLRRFKQVVAALSDCYVVDGWHESFDRKTAARLQKYLEGQAAGKRPHYRSERELIDFLGAHGQSIDFVYMGRISSMVCLLAATSRAAADLRDKPAGTPA